MFASIYVKGPALMLAWDTNSPHLYNVHALSNITDTEDNDLSVLSFKAGK